MEKRWRSRRPLTIRVRGTREAAYFPPYVWEYGRCSRGGSGLEKEKQDSHGEEMAKEEIINLCMGALIYRSPISCFSITSPCEYCFCSRGGSEVWEKHMNEKETIIDLCISMVFSVPISSSCESCLSQTP